MVPSRVANGAGSGVFQAPPWGEGRRRGSVFRLVAGWLAAKKTAKPPGAHG